MADKLLTTGMNGNPLRLVDNGDGSYSLSVSGGTESGGTVAPAPRKQIWHNDRVTVPAESSKVLLEELGLIEIDFLEFITHDLGDSANLGASLKIEFLQNGSWKNMTIMRNILNAYPNQKLTPNYLFDNVSSMWVTNVYNPETNIYKYALKDKVTAYEGLRITAVNDSATETKYLGVFFMGSAE